MFCPLRSQWSFKGDIHDNCCFLVIAYQQPHYLCHSNLGFVLSSVANQYHTKRAHGWEGMENSIIFVYAGLVPFVQQMADMNCILLWLGYCRGGVFQKSWWGRRIETVQQCAARWQSHDHWTDWNQPHHVSSTTSSCSGNTACLGGPVHQCCHQRILWQFWSFQSARCCSRPDAWNWVCIYLIICLIILNLLPL